MAIQELLVNRLKEHLRPADQEVIVRETHISWVLLSGAFAWKIKKAVDFGFLDFSSLAKREFACREELRLNRRFAPELYLEVTPICGTPKHPTLAKCEHPIEYAVHMRRFDESCLFSELAGHGRLRHKHIDALAIKLAKIHGEAAVAEPDTPWGEPAQIDSWLRQSIEQIIEVDASRLAEVDWIRLRCEKLFKDCYERMQTRRANGFIRECHGDLHLGNIVWYQHRALPFDCIEFNPALRWIDLFSELAFVVMDLQYRGYSPFAWRFLNHYLGSNGDYDGLAMLRYYACYRALVRAKVALLQKNKSLSADQNRALDHQSGRYLSLARQWLTRFRPVLMITHGLSASGKSTVAANIAERYGAIHIRSDVERKRLYGLSALDSSNSGVNTGIYRPSASNKTYQRLLTIAKTVLKAGYPLIVDAAFLQRNRRRPFQQLAHELQLPFLVIYCDADQQTLRQRIVERKRQSRDPSEATMEVLEKQFQEQQAPGREEPSVRVTESRPCTLPDEIINILRS